MSENGNGQLTGLQRAFINEWFEDFNGVKAAERAGYKGDYWTLASIASENLKKPKIQAELERRWALHGITAEEVVSRLADMARGNMADFITEFGAIDWAAVHEKGHLVKKIVHRKGQESQIELYDAKGALELIGKTMGLFVTKKEITGAEGGPIRVEHELELDTDTIKEAIAILGSGNSCPGCRS